MRPILIPRRPCLRLAIWISVWLFFLCIYQSLRGMQSDNVQKNDLQLSETAQTLDFRKRNGDGLVGKGKRHSRRRYPKLDDEYFTPQAIDVAKKAIVYSAYIDFRHGNMGPAIAVRIMALVHEQDKPWLQCRFRLPTGQHDFRNVSYYETPEPHGATYAAYVLSCLLPDDIAASVNLITKVELSEINGHTVSIPISNRVIDIPNGTTTGRRYQHSICVPTLFKGRYTGRHLVEFIEAHSILGVEHFFFYVLDSDFDQFQKVLQFYRGRGRLTYFKLQLSIGAEMSSVWNYAQSLVVQDCVFRNAGYSRYLMLNDIDEYFVPYFADTWSDLSSSILWREPNRAGYALPTFYFRPQTPGAPTEEDVGEEDNGAEEVEEEEEEEEEEEPEIASSALPAAPLTLSHILASPNADTLLTKCIIRPERVFDQGIHHVSRVIQDYYLITKPDTSIAALHHFKDPMRAFSDVGKATTNRTRLKDLMKKGNRLMKAYGKVIKLLRI